MYVHINTCCTYIDTNIYRRIYMFSRSRSSHVPLLGDERKHVRDINNANPGLGCEWFFFSVFFFLCFLKLQQPLQTIWHTKAAAMMIIMMIRAKQMMIKFASPLDNGQTSVPAGNNNKKGSCCCWDLEKKRLKRNNNINDKNKKKEQEPQRQICRPF